MGGMGDLFRLEISKIFLGKVMELDFELAEQRVVVTFYEQRCRREAY